MEYIERGTKQEVIYWAKRLYEKGMSPSTSGNISTKTDKGILISASGTCMYDMDENDVVLIDYSGNLIEGNKRASSEQIMHSEIYTMNDEINAIIHCHCPVLSAFAVADKPIKKPILPDFALLFDEVPVVPYFCPSSIDLATTVGEYFKKYTCVLLKNHGIILGADSLQNAFYQLEVLRSYAETYFGAEILGGAKAISKKDVLEIKTLYSKK